MDIPATMSTRTGRNALFVIAIAACLAISTDLAADAGHWALVRVWRAVAGSVPSSYSDMPLTAFLQKLVHLTVFAVVGALIGMEEVRRHRKLAASALLGVVSEWAQALTQTRLSSPWDALLNVVSLLVGYTSCLAVRANSKEEMDSYSQMVSESIRRMIDVALSGIGLLVFSPALAVAALAVWWEDGFPILFRQTRVGVGGQPFTLLKLRSMRNTAGTAITAGGDSRVTRSGRFLRQYKLDELPQLWNVLRGDMSLIGPRPEVPKFVDVTDPVWRQVLSVRPGITDLASLLYRDEESLLAGAADPELQYRNTILPRKLAIAAQGVRQRSLWGDVKILVFTVLSSFFPGRFSAISKTMAHRGSI